MRLHFLAVHNGYMVKMKTRVRYGLYLLILVISECYCVHWLELVIGPSLGRAEENVMEEGKNLKINHAVSLKSIYFRH